MAYQVIIPAAGQGKRMGAGKNKLLLELDHTPVLIHTLNTFEKDDACTSILLAIHPQDQDAFTALLQKNGISKVAAFVPGGKERQHSVYHAVKTIKDDGIVLVHDGARPFVDQELIASLIKAAEEKGAAVLAVPVKDTVKKVAQGMVTETVERSSLWAIQTPQAFRLSILLEAHEKAMKDQFIGTDDASLVERLGLQVMIVEGNYDNIKLTTPEDLYFAEAIIRKRKEKINE